MVALLSQDSDSEFGYDLSPEDEAALIQLASPTAAPPRHPLIAPGADVVKSESQYDDAESLLAAGGVAAVFAGSEPSVPPLSLGRDVHYPDCAYRHLPGRLCLCIHADL